jgi:ABC-type uncharacterized transport system fused permease/ATPase subunit
MYRNDLLTPGEQQRLSLVRVVYHRPTLVIIDEGTNAIGIDAEMEFYSTLQQVI